MLNTVFSKEFTKQKCNYNIHLFLRDAFHLIANVSHRFTKF